MKKFSPFVEKKSALTVLCTLCPRRCHINNGERGSCGTRRNINGDLEVVTWGRLAAVAVDPIEKKPLAHFMPGSLTFSVGTEGCNLICPFCQNAGLSQCPQMPDYSSDDVRRWTPVEVVEMAHNHSCKSIAFTYSEPVLSIEFALEVAQLASMDALPVIFVTNGQINAKPLKLLQPHLAAANVDLKSANPVTYRKVLKGTLANTLNTIEFLSNAGTWVEVTTLLVPGMNTSTGEIQEIARFIADISKDMPWHVSRFHPAYLQTNSPPTDSETILAALEIGAEAGLRYVYAGNMPTAKGENTCCPNCKDVVVDRTGFRVNRINTQNGQCPKCGWHIAGVGLP